LNQKETVLKTHRNESRANSGNSKKEPYDYEKRVKTGGGSRGYSSRWEGNEILGDKNWVSMRVPGKK